MLTLISAPKPHPTRKAEMMQVILSQIRGPLLEQVWRTFTDLERLLVQEAAHSEYGLVEEEMFRAKYGKVSASYSETGPDTASRLSFFLFPAGRYARRCTYVPPDMRERLREFVPPPPEAQLDYVDELPETVVRVRRGGNPENRKWHQPIERREMEIAAAHDLTAVLRLVDQGKISVSSSTRRASGTSMVRIAESLQGGDCFDAAEKKKDSWSQVPGPVRSFAWPLLIQAGRLAQLKGSKLVLTKAGRGVLSMSGVDALRQLWDKWLGTKLLDEFNRIEGIKGQGGKGKRYLEPPIHRRDVIADALAQCPVSEWVQIDEFLRFMRAGNFAFEVSQEPWRLYIGDREYGSLDYYSNKWHMVEGQYVRCFLFEYAATLGMIDVAYSHPEGAREEYTGDYGDGCLAYLSRYDGFEYFRLTPLGAYVLELVSEYDSPIPRSIAAFSVHSDLRIQVLRPMSGEEHITLELWANQVSEDLWRIDRDKTVLALQGAHQVDELRDFLAQRDDQPLPEQVEAFLLKVQRDSGALMLSGDARLLTCQSAEVLERIRSDSKLGKLCMQAGKLQLVVPESKWSAFQKAVRQLGLGIKGL